MESEYRPAVEYPADHKITKDDIELISVDFRCHTYILEQEPEKALWRFDGMILIHHPEEHEPEYEIGRITAYRFFDDTGWSAFNALDSVSAETAEFIELAEDEDTFGDLDCFGQDLLILTEIYIDPRFRGHNIGLLAARHAVMLATSTSIVACKPFPLQFSGWEDPEWQKENPGLGEADFQRALFKLQAYWQQMGFEEWKNSGLYILSTAHKFPSAEDLAAGKFSPIRHRNPKIKRPRHRHPKPDSTLVQ